MAIVQPKSIKYRKMAAHCLMVAFILAILFPLYMVIMISFREGNFATNVSESFVDLFLPKFDSLTLNHWKLAFGIPVNMHLPV